MSERVINQAELNELMRKGWSWRSSGGGGSSTVNGYLIDTATGKQYKLSVVNGELTMSEVS